MTLKSYFSATVESAMAQAVKELGPEAMLIYSRETPAETRNWGRYEVVFGWETAGATTRPSEQSGAIDVGPWEARLHNAEFCPNFVTKVLRACRREQSEASLRDTLEHQLQRRIPVADKDSDSFNPILLVGPAGVGKSMTAAKLVFLFSIRANRPVHLVSTDTVRMCGGDWLERFAALTETAFSSADSVDALDRLLRAEPPERTMLIDGAGWLLEDQHRRSFAALRRAHPNLQVHLVLPCTTRLADLRTCFSRYQPLNPDRIVAARLDESASAGAICSIAAEQEVPISYITQGEDPSQGIEKASLSRLLAPVFDAIAGGLERAEQTLAVAGGRA